MRLPPETARLNQMAARFAPVDIRVDLSGLPAGERRALASLIKAARITDALFMRQMWAGNESMLMRLMEDTTPLGRARLDYFLINRGPWSRLDDNAIFIPARPAEAGGCEFLPVGRDEIRRRGLGEWPRRRRTNRRNGLLHDDPSRRGRKIRGRAVQPRVPGRACRDGATSSRCGRGDSGCHAEGVSRSRGRTHSHRTTTTRAMSPG